MIAAAREEVVSNTTALVKGSRFMRMERVVQALAAEAQKGAH
jgi:UDP-N-acetylmuramyl pentapeptide synthase